MLKKVNYSRYALEELKKIKKGMKVRLDEMLTNTEKDKVVRDQIEQVKNEIRDVELAIAKKGPQVEFGKRKALR
jgi:predicted DNA-binding protein